MPTRIPARNVAGDQILRSATRASEEVQQFEYTNVQMVQSHNLRAVSTATDAMVNMNTRVGVAAPAAAAAVIPITINRGLRIVSITFDYAVITATTPPTIDVRLRHNSAAGTIATTNHLANQWSIGPAGINVNIHTTIELTLPFGGIDFPPQTTAQAIGFSIIGLVGTVTNGNISISMVGYEYA